MANILFQNLQKRKQNNNSPLYDSISNLKNSGSSNAVFNRLYQTNSQFRQFANSVKGKSPEQAFSEHGLDFNQFRSFKW